MSSPETEILRVFYVDSRQHLYTYALSITANREAAEDAIQRVFQQLLQRGKLPADLRPYIFRCVRNAALDGLRRGKVRGDSIFEVEQLPDAGGPDVATGLRKAELDQWLTQLSADEREAIVLKTYDDFTFQQIADLRQVPLPTVASWYRRGIEKLKELATARTQ
jgi:RNA polymerase sigma-70 factor (ECF subfamily)